MTTSEQENERNKEPQIPLRSLPIYYMDGGTGAVGGTPPPPPPPLQSLVDQKTVAAAMAGRITTRHPRFPDLPPSLYYMTSPTCVVSTLLLKIRNQGIGYRHFPLTAGNLSF